MYGPIQEKGHGARDGRVKFAVFTKTLTSLMILTLEDLDRQVIS
jgi:hypothetical protein